MTSVNIKFEITFDGGGGVSVMDFGVILIGNFYNGLVGNIIWRIALIAFLFKNNLTMTYSRLFTCLQNEWKFTHATRINKTMVTRRWHTN